VVVFAHRGARFKPRGLGHGSNADGGDLDQFCHIFIVAGGTFKPSDYGQVTMVRYILKLSGGFDEDDANRRVQGQVPGGNG
jgi:hypothetical protein